MNGDVNIAPNWKIFVVNFNGIFNLKERVLIIFHDGLQQKHCGEGGIKINFPKYYFTPFLSDN
jgi:hypothetical protein